jgi:hypothetical protein
MQAVEKAKLVTDSTRPEGVSLSSVASHPIHSVDAYSGAAVSARENAARAALDLLAGRTLTDSDWASVGGKLLEFVTILRRWAETSENAVPGLGNVEALCEKEP